jgi:hypothetical protein
VLNIMHLRSLEQGQDILAHHPPKNGATGPPPEKKAKHEDPSMEEGEEEPSSADLEENAGAENGAKSEAPMPLRMNLRERSVEAFQSLRNKPVDGLGESVGSFVQFFGSRRAKIKHKNSKVNQFHFLKYWMLSFGS